MYILLKTWKTKKNLFFERLRRGVGGRAFVFTTSNCRIGGEVESS